MNRRELTPRRSLEDTMGATVAENKSSSSSTSAVSRRPGRVFVEDQDVMESGNAGTNNDSRYGSSDERDKDKSTQRQHRRASSNISIATEMIPMVDLGKDMCGIFPTTVEEMGKQVIKSLQAAKTSTEAKEDGRPLNFGTVLPGSIYRSSFPLQEDFQFLATLGLKTIITLVKKDYPPEFLAFMKANGIRHCVIDMKGTKKVDIPDHIMQSILQVALEKENHPLLIHCNHGKHRTGCVTGVIRHISGWPVPDIITEYSGYAEPKVRECDIKYITEYQVSDLEGLFLRNLARNGDRKNTAVLLSSKMNRFLVATAMALVVWVATVVFWQR